MAKICLFDAAKCDVQTYESIGWNSYERELLKDELYTAMLDWVHQHRFEEVLKTELCVG